MKLGRIDPAAIDRIWHAARHWYRAGMHPAIQVCLRHNGTVVLNRAIGHGWGNGPDDPPDAPKVPITTETPFCAYSAAKAVTSTVMHMLVERGHFALDDLVRDDHAVAFNFKIRINRKRSGLRSQKTRENLDRSQRRVHDLAICGIVESHHCKLFAVDSCGFARILRFKRQNIVTCNNCLNLRIGFEIIFQSFRALLFAFASEAQAQQLPTVLFDGIPIPQKAIILHVFIKIRVNIQNVFQTLVV